MTSISKNEDYYCPDCDSIIEFGQTKCNNCGCHIDWSDEIKEDLTYNKDVILKNNNYKGKFIMKKEKTKNKFETIIFILIIIGAILFYPFFVKVENGETICSNLLGMKMQCR